MGRVRLRQEQWCSDTAASAPRQWHIGTDGKASNNTRARNPMSRDPLVIQRTPQVRGDFVDTRDWLAAYSSKRRDVLRALHRIPALAEVFRNLQSTAVYRIEWPSE